MLCRERRGGDRGFTLLEMMIATAIIAAVIGLSMILLHQASSTTRVNMLQTHYEGRLQEALDDITMRIIETSPGKVSLFAYDLDGQRHTAITFPSARGMDGNYVLVDEMGIVSAVPHWQCIVVYAYHGGMVRRYEDYTPRSYTNVAYVTNVGAATMDVWDGSTTIQFNLDGTPMNANQKIEPILDQARRLFAHEEQEVGDPQVPPNPPDLLPVPPIYESLNPPLNLVIEAEIQVGIRGRETLVVRLDTSVLARNQN
ncbi:MAG: prepilin-type N-terminal cleavage/methylation domain-containing protein [Planctomycetes bacterium]|nr:prepilin-type N-terminal cleavage/methylation domain-containing protein [Planctomycetota bacterium]